MSRPTSSSGVYGLTESIVGSNAFLVDFKGLDVERSKVLRTQLRDCDARLRIVKNSG